MNKINLKHIVRLPKYICIRKNIRSVLFILSLLFLLVPHKLRAQENPDSIQLIACDTTQVDIRMAHYRIRYSYPSTKGFLLITPEDDSTGALATAFLSESSFHLLQPEILQSIQANDFQDSLVITFRSQTSWAKFTTHLIFYKACPGLLHWTTSIQLLDWHSISSFDRDVKFLKLDPHSALQPLLIKYADQDGMAAGLAYFYEANFLKSTLLYFQDFSFSNDYFQWIHASPQNTIKISDASFGYSLPTSTANLKRGFRYTLTSAYLYLRPGKPLSENEMARRFLEELSAIYTHLYKPAVPNRNWQEVAAHTLQDLTNSKCWVTVDGQEFLRAYVDIPRYSSAEMIAQLDVLLGLTKLKQTTDTISALREKLEATLPYFYNTEYNQIVNNYPNQGISRGDSWYTIELAIGLSQLAKMGSTLANNLLFASIQAIMQFAQTVNYDFPVFFSYDTYQRISGEEPDVAGGYAYLMLNCYDLTDNSLYLNEAKKSIKHIQGRGMNLSYELQMSAASAAACARLYQHTGDNSYRSLSYIPLANILRHTWLWECNYGTAQDYSTFFGMSPMPHANVITMKEQYETWEFVREYLSIMASDLSSDIQNILQGFVQYTPNVLYYSLPPHLPDAARWKKTAIYGSNNDNSLYIPYEDLRDGWQQSGQIGQEIYGAGGVFSFAAILHTSVRQHRNIGNPSKFGLIQIYPNPFSKQTTLCVTSSRPGEHLSHGTQLIIYNALGQVVRCLTQNEASGDQHLFYWNGKKNDGLPLPTGIYFAVLKSNRVIARKKILLLK